jgi:hypothetical protein
MRFLMGSDAVCQRLEICAERSPELVYSLYFYKSVEIVNLCTYLLQEAAIR